MTEGRVFVCSWKRVGDRYRVWVKGRPRLAAEATDFAAADEELSGVICTATGDGESLHVSEPHGTEVHMDSRVRTSPNRLPATPIRTSRHPPKRFGKSHGRAIHAVPEQHRREELARCFIDFHFLGLGTCERNLPTIGSARSHADRLTRVSSHSCPGISVSL